MKKKEKPKVGDKLWSLNTGNMARHSKQILTPVNVVKVGRKYFVCRRDGSDSDWSNVQYLLSDWREKSEYTATSILFTSPQEWEDSKEEARICQFVYGSFTHGSNPGLSLGDLKIIEKILKVENPELAEG